MKPELTPGVWYLVSYPKFWENGLLVCRVLDKYGGKLYFYAQLDKDGTIRPTSFEGQYGDINVPIHYGNPVPASIVLAEAANEIAQLRLQQLEKDIGHHKQEVLRQFERQHEALHYVHRGVQIPEELLL